MNDRNLASLVYNLYVLHVIYKDYSFVSKIMDIESCRGHVSVLLL